MNTGTLSLRPRPHMILLYGLQIAGDNLVYGDVFIT